ncbi:hypothetical protein CIB48_g11210, partial [Xylaria polymorpha]
MAGLVPQHAQAIAQILVRYMAGTGALYPSRRLAPAPADPDPSGITHPPPARPPAQEGNGAQSEPGRTKSSPKVLDGGDEEDCDDDMPDDPVQTGPWPTGIPVQERPAVPPSGPTPTPPSVTRPLGPPDRPSSKVTSTSSRHLSSSSSPSSSPSSFSSSFSSPSSSSSKLSPSLSSTSSSSRPPHTTTPSSDPDPPEITR